MRNNNYLVKLEETNGEFEHFQYSHIEAKNDSDAYKQAVKLAKSWYGGKPREEDGVYYFCDGAVAVSLYQVTELTEVETVILRKFGVI